MRPVLFELPFGMPIYSYGVMLMTAVLAGRLVALSLAERRGITREVADRCAFWTLIGAMIGTRLLWVVPNFDQIHSPLDVIAVWRGGIVVYGGFLGGLAGAITFCRLHRLSLLTWSDCVTPALCLGLAIGRIGCFLGGCDFGRPWDGPFAVQFPAYSQASTEQARLGLLITEALPSLPVHPTQLYESIAGLTLLVIVGMVLRRRLRAGHALVTFAMGYAVVRYFVEMVRADPGRGMVGPWSTSQFIAIVTFVAAAAVLYVLRQDRSRANFAAAV